jgi:hypothetical protein
MTSHYKHTLEGLLVVFVILGCAAIAAAQPPGLSTTESGGLTYVVAFPDTTNNVIDARFPSPLADRATLMIYSAVASDVRVRGVGLDTTYRAVAGRFAVLELAGRSGARPIVTEHCTPAGNTYRIDAADPVIVYQFMSTRSGAEAWTPQPVTTWGTEYYAAAHEGEVLSDIAPGTGKDGWRGRNRMGPAEIIVIAAYDDTRITIIPNGQILNACRAENVTLKAGEAYSMQSYVDTLTANIGGDQPDFGGSRIFSTKPVGVISGNTRAQLLDVDVTLGENSFRNMLIESLAPVEQFGTEFVYLPSWDSRRPTGEPTENPAEKRLAEFVRVYASSDTPTNGYYLQDGVPIQYDRPIESARFAEIRHTPTMARVHRTDRPAQAMMSSAPAIRDVTTGSGNTLVPAYDVWGGSMVTLIPREQWASFAPVFVPGAAEGMESFVNVVTDSAHRRDITIDGSRLPLERTIPGTDLVWGAIQVGAGTTYVIEGANGARFSGNVYGARMGHEEFRRAGNEYREYVGLAYSYPFVGTHNVAGASDSLEIKKTYSCGPGMARLNLEVEAVNDNPIGLRSVRLDSAVNAAIVYQNPFPLTGAVKATISVATIDPSKDASATVVIKDRSGKVTRVAYRTLAEHLVLEPSAVNFGVMQPGMPATRTITLTNPLDRPLSIHDLRMVFGNQGFTVVQAPALPVVLPPNGTISLGIGASAAASRTSYRDTLVIDLSCSRWKIPLMIDGDTPCLNVWDIDFGAQEPGSSRTMNLDLCNIGDGRLDFENPNGGEVIEWHLPGFSIPAQQLRVLRDTTLASRECVTLAITYTGQESGIFSDTARVWTVANDCRTVSYWVARVGPMNSAPVTTAIATSLFDVEPNPVDATGLIRYSLAASGHARLELFDSRGERVAMLLDEDRDAGPHAMTLDVSPFPPGVYHYRLSANGVSILRSLVRK